LAANQLRREAREKDAVVIHKVSRRAERLQHPRDDDCHGHLVGRPGGNRAARARFDLPELQNTEFRLIGGRMAYVGQSPGAHLLFGVRKHQISVFVFQDRESFAGLSASPQDSDRLSFSLETWSDRGLRYVVIGDASPADVRALGGLLRAASR